MGKMKKLLYLLLLLPFASFGQGYLPMGNALSRQILAGDTSFKFALGSPGAWFPLTFTQVNRLITAAGAGFVPTSRTLTINGTTFDLSANRTWSVGTVTSITPGVGFVSHTPITGAGTMNVDTSGLIASKSWSLAAFYTKVQGDGKYQLLSNLETTLTNSSSLYPSGSAVTTALSAYVLLNSGAGTQTLNGKFLFNVGPIIAFGGTLNYLNSGGAASLAVGAINTTGNKTIVFPNGNTLDTVATQAFSRSQVGAYFKLAAPNTTSGGLNSFNNTENDFNTTTYFFGNTYVSSPGQFTMQAAVKMLFNDPSNSSDQYYIKNLGGSSGLFIGSNIGNYGPLIKDTSFTARNAFFNRVAVGTTTLPTVSLEVESQSTAATRGVIFGQANNGTQSSRILLQKSRGTPSTPLTIVTADVISNLVSRAYDGTNFIDVSAFRTTSTGTVGTGSISAFIDLQTANAGTLSTVATFGADLSTTLNGRFLMQGNITEAWPNTAGAAISVAAATYTDNTSTTGTVANLWANNIGQPTIAATNASVVYTQGATFHVSNSPANGTNATVTQPTSILTDNGNVIFGGNGRLGIGQAAGTNPGALLDIVPNGFTTGSNFAVNGFAARFEAGTISSTGSGGTIASSGDYTFAQTTLTSPTNATTLTTHGLVYIAGASVASTGVTITNNVALWVAGGQSLFAGGMSTNVSPTAANLYGVGGSAASSSNQASIGFGGSNNVMFHGLVNGGTSTTIGSSAQNAANFIFGSTPYTTSTSGTNAWIANVVVNAVGSITTGAGGTAASNSASLYINGQNGNATLNYNIVSYSPGASTNNAWFKYGTTRVSALRIDSVTNIAVTQAQNDVTGQTAANTSIATFTTTAAGTYRIGGYVNITAVAVDIIEMQVTYTDENNTAQTANFFTQGATSALLSAVGNSVYPTMDLRVKSGGVITVKTTLTTGGGSITYDAGATITQLR